MIAMMFASASILTTNAQDMTTSSPTTETTQSAETSFFNSDFDSLWFQIPAGTTVEKGSQYKAFFPDGSFGINMIKINRPANRKISVKLCERAADSLHIPRTSVKKVSFGKAKGAMGEGVVDGKLVKIIVLAYDDHQIQIVIMADKNREEWVKHFLSSLKK